MRAAIAISFYTRRGLTKKQLHPQNRIIFFNRGEQKIRLGLREQAGSQAQISFKTKKENSS